MTHLQEVLQARDLWVNLTLRELRGKYKRSFLGWGWSLLKPLAMTGIFTLVFSVLLKQDPASLRAKPAGSRCSPCSCVCAAAVELPVERLDGGMFSLVGNANLVKKVYFPREVLVASNVASWLFSLLIEMSVLCVALLGFGNMVLPWLPLVIVLMAIQAVFVLGIALMLSSSTCTSVTRSTSSASRCRSGSTARRSSIRSRWAAASPRCVAARVRDEPHDAVREGVSQRALRPARAVARYLAYLVAAALASFALGVVVFRGSRDAWRRSCDGNVGRVVRRAVITVESVTKKFRLYDETQPESEGGADARPPCSL